MGLKPHPEGGHFRETYRSDEVFLKEALPPRFNGPRAFTTCIMFMLDKKEYSLFHRIKSDEIWHFYDGAPLTIHVIKPDGEYNRIHMGKDMAKEQQLQATIPRGAWFGATVDDTNSFSLVGCTVTPGFDFEDFEMASRDAMIEKFPQHATIIERLT